MRSLALAIAVLALDTTIGSAQTTLERWTFSGAAGVSAAGLVSLSANLGDPVSGPASGATVELWHGFWGPDTVLAVGIEPGTPALRTWLGIAAPNPAFERTRLRFGLPRASSVRVRVYDVGGRLVRQVLRASLPAGEHDLAWNLRRDDGARAPAGIYVLRLETGDGFRAQRKFVVFE